MHASCPLPSERSGAPRSELPTTRPPSPAPERASDISRARRRGGSGAATGEGGGAGATPHAFSRTVLKSSSFGEIHAVGGQTAPPV
jgi:hypothetical protein